MLHKDTLCGTCFAVNPLTAYEQKLADSRLKRKPKSKHNVEANVQKYIDYMIANPDIDTFNKKHFTEMGIQVTSVNYLMKVLKKRGYIKTVGQVGKQKYIADVSSIVNIRECISMLRNIMGITYNEKFTIRKEESVSNT